MMQTGWGGVGRREPETLVSDSGRSELKPHRPKSGPLSLRIGDRVVTLFAPHEQPGQATRRFNVDLDLVPLAVADEVRRSITDRVLVPKLKGDLLEDVIHFSGAIGIKGLTARDSSQLVENALSLH